jgi:hypothetical protein
MTKINRIADFRHPQAPAAYDPDHTVWAVSFGIEPHSPAATGREQTPDEGRGAMTAGRILNGVLAALTVMESVAGVADAEFAVGDHLKLSASDRVRGEFVSWFDPSGPKSDNNYNFFANRLRFGGTLSFPMIEVVVEGQDTEMVNLPGGDSINPTAGPLGPGAVYFANTHTRDQGEVFLHLGYATLRDFGLPGVALRGGRFGYNQGLEKVAQDPTLAWLQRARISQRLIGNFDYTNVGRSFDGLQALYDNGPFNLTVMASHPTFGGFNVNANKDIERIGLISATASVVEPKAFPATTGQFFFIYYSDQRNLVATDNRPRDLPPGETCATNDNGSLIRSCDTGHIEMSTMGVDLVHVIDLGPGKLDLLTWVAGQVGDWQSLDHRAWAVATEVGYQFPTIPLKPWVRLNHFISSGDHDPTDDEHETFFQLLPTARAYALFPFFNLMNSEDLFLQTILKPLSNVTAAVTGHWLRVADSNDLWYAGGGATSNTFFGYSGVAAKGRDELAYLTDLELTYVYDKHLTLYGYYGRAFGQGVVSSNFAGNNADYGYIEATVSF